MMWRFFTFLCCLAIFQLSATTNVLAFAGSARKDLEHLRSILENIGGTVFQVQFALPNAYNAFDDAGHLKSASDEARLKEIVKSIL